MWDVFYLFACMSSYMSTLISPSPILNPNPLNLSLYFHLTPTLTPLSLYSLESDSDGMIYLLPHFIPNIPLYSPSYFSRIESDSDGMDVEDSEEEEYAETKQRYGQTDRETE